MGTQVEKDQRQIEEFENMHAFEDSPNTQKRMGIITFRQISFFQKNKKLICKVLKIPQSCTFVNEMFIFGTIIEKARQDVARPEKNKMLPDSQTTNHINLSFAK